MVLFRSLSVKLRVILLLFAGCEKYGANARYFYTEEIVIQKLNPNGSRKTTIHLRLSRRNNPVVFAYYNEDGVIVVERPEIRVREGVKNLPLVAASVLSQYGVDIHPEVLICKNQVGRFRLRHTSVSMVVFEAKIPHEIISLDGDMRTKAPLGSHGVCVEVTDIPAILMAAQQGKILFAEPADLLYLQEWGVSPIRPIGVISKRTPDHFTGRVYGQPCAA